MRKLAHKSHISTVTAAGLLITLGIVYGDIGTSPLYVMKAIVYGADTINTNFILEDILYLLDPYFANHSKVHNNHPACRQ